MQFLKTSCAAVLLLAIVPLTAAAQGRYVVVSTDRPAIPVDSRQCPAYESPKVQEFEDKEAAKAAAKEARQLKQGRGDPQVWTFDKGQVVAVYSYLATSRQFSHCEYTKYGAAAGKTPKQAEERMKQHAKDFPKNFVGEPSMMKVIGP